jgi:hypothetical protein
MNIPDLIFENLVSVFWVKYTSVLLCGSGVLNLVNSGSVMEKIGTGIRDKHPGFATLRLQISIVCLFLRSLEPRLLAAFLLGKRDLKTTSKSDDLFYSLRL